MGVDSSKGCSAAVSNNKGRIVWAVEKMVQAKKPDSKNHDVQRRICVDAGIHLVMNTHRQRRHEAGDEI